MDVTFANTSVRGFDINLSDIDVTFANTSARGSTIDLNDIDITFTNTLARGSTIDLGDINVNFTNTWQGAPPSTSMTFTSSSASTTVLLNQTFYPGPNHLQR
jgi:hypothetical protein